MPPGYPIILLKSNYFYMAAVSVKRSIRVILEMYNKYGLHLNDWIEVAVRKIRHNEFHCRMIAYNKPLFRSVAGT